MNDDLLNLFYSEYPGPKTPDVDAFVAWARGRLREEPPTMTYALTNNVGLVLPDDRRVALAPTRDGDGPFRAPVYNMIGAPFVPPQG